MTRSFVIASLLKLIAVFACFAVFSLFAPVSFAQHGGGGHGGGGGHFGGGAHFGGAPHVSTPRASAPGAAHVPGLRSRSSFGPPPLGAGTTAFHFRPRPIRPPRGLPVFPFPVLFGGPFFGFGPGFGFNYLWWPSCDPLWGWGFGCASSPFFGYGAYGYGVGGYGLGGYGLGTYDLGTYGYPYIPPSYEPPPVSTYGGYGGGSARELPILYFTDGSAYFVTDYWLVEGQLHFIVNENGGAKSTEHALPFEQLDLQRTIDANARLGFKFVLRNEPLNLYLQHHPDPGSDEPSPPE